MDSVSGISATLPVVTAEVRRARRLRDLTDPAFGPHSLQCLVEDTEIALRNVWRCRAERHGGERATQVLHSLRKPPGDVLLSCPRLVLRPDEAGRPDDVHELTVWRVRSGRPLTTESADAMVHTVLSTLVPGIAYVGEETDAPLLVDALTLSIRDGDADDGSALHVGECGLVRRDVLSQAGFDDDTSALALRLCLEPIVMVRKGFRDARLLRSDDPCIARQMLDLGRYRAPSSGSDGPVV